MSQKRKRAFATWADAEIAYEVSSRMLSVLDIALREMVLGKVKWLEGHQPRKVGLCKLDGAHGGVVILVEREMIGAQYLDEWVTRIQSQEAPPTKKEYMPEYKAWLDLRRLAAKAKDEQRIVNERLAEEAKGCQRSALPGVVDQDVRTY